MLNFLSNIPSRFLLFAGRDNLPDSISSCHVCQQIAVAPTDIMRRGYGIRIKTLGHAPMLLRMSRPRIRTIPLINFQHILMAGLIFPMLLLSACTPSAETDIDPARELTVEAPKGHAAGEPMTITAELPGVPDETIGRLTLLGSYGVWLYEGEFAKEKVVFNVPSSDMEHAGFVTAVVKVDGMTTRERFEIIPGEAVEPLTPLVGPRTITANGKSWSIAAVIPFDKFANPIVDGSTATFRIFHPGNVLETFRTDTRHLVAWLRVNSKTQAGKTFITAQVGDAFGKETELLEMADWPVPFTMTNEPEVVVADGKQLTQVRTSRIVDQFGNVMPDGTLVQFIVTDEDGFKRILPSKTVDGFAHLPLQAPLRPTRFTVVATVFAIESEPLVVNFSPGPAIGAFPLDMAEGDGRYDGYMTFTAGPLLGERDQYIPDGTPVLFRLVHETGKVVEEEVVSDDGYALFAERQALLLAGSYTVQAYVGTGEGRLTFEYGR